MSIAYAVTNALSALAATAFTWSTADTADRTFLNDGRVDKRFLVSNSASGLTLVINMGSAVSLCGIAVLNSNIAEKAGAALRVRAATDAAITAGVITPKPATTLNLTAPKQKDHVLQFPATATKQYWELTWTWSSGNHQLKLGEVFAFTSSTQLSRAPIYGSGEGEFFRVAQNDMASGGIRAVFQAGPVRRLMLKWKDHTSTQRDELRTLWRTVKGPATPFLYIPSYEATTDVAADAEQECIYGRLRLTDFSFSQPDFNLFDPPDLELVAEGREAGS